MNAVSERVSIACLASLLTFTSLTGCSYVGWMDDEPDRAVDNPAMVSASAQEADEEQVVSLSELMLQRLQLCLRPAEDRSRLLDDYRALYVDDIATTEHLDDDSVRRTNELNALMLASCDPARTPGVLSEMLATVTSEEEWSADYMAFFDLLVASHRAYVLVDESRVDLNKKFEHLQLMHEQLQQDYQALQVEHENTIKGISDIERSIDLPEAEDLGL